MSQLLLPYPLVVRVPCRTSAEPGARAKVHAITLEADGSVTTPHDLDNERIAAALGGYLSCLDLIDKAVPAFHLWVSLHLRQHPRPIVTNDYGVTWSPERTRPCCRWNGYAKPDDAAQHARDAVHAAALHDADQHQVRALIRGACIPDPPQPYGQIEAQLWSCGIDPGRAAVMRDHLPDGFRPPADFYLAALVTGVDLAWVGNTLAQTRREPQLATWLAWTQSDDDRRDPDLRSRWLRLGATPWAILSLSRSGYRTHDIGRLAESWGQTTSAVAQFLADWVEHGYNPEPEALLRDRFPDLPIPPRAPATSAITRLRTALGSCSQQSTDTDLAVLLVTHGTVAHTVRALNPSGYTTYRPTRRKKTS